MKEIFVTTYKLCGIILFVLCTPLIGAILFTYGTLRFLYKVYTTEFKDRP